MRAYCAVLVAVFLFIPVLMAGELCEHEKLLIRQANQKGEPISFTLLQRTDRLNIDSLLFISLPEEPNADVSATLGALLVILLTQNSCGKNPWVLASQNSHLKKHLSFIKKYLANNTAFCDIGSGASGSFSDNIKHVDDFLGWCANLSLPMITMLAGAQMLAEPSSPLPSAQIFAGGVAGLTSCLLQYALRQSFYEDQSSSNKISAIFRTTNTNKVIVLVDTYDETKIRLGLHAEGFRAQPL